MTNNRNESSDVLLLYDSFRHRAEIILAQNGITFRRIYYFDTNEIFLIRSIIKIIFYFQRQKNNILKLGDDSGQMTCNVEKLNETVDGFFNLIGTLNAISPPNEVFHFNNNFPIVTI